MTNWSKLFVGARALTVPAGLVGRLVFEVKTVRLRRTRRAEAVRATNTRFVCSIACFPRGPQHQESRSCYYSPRRHVPIIGWDNTIHSESTTSHRKAERAPRAGWGWWSSLGRDCFNVLADASFGRGRGPRGRRAQSRRTPRWTDPHRRVQDAPPAVG